jgi:cytochrome c oxidase subunit 1
MFTQVVYLMWSLKKGKKAAQNPWGATTLEWQAPTPPTLYNFSSPPVLHEIYNYDDLVEEGEDNWVRKPANPGKPTGYGHGPGGHH